VSYSESRVCPDCGSHRVALTQRGLTGPTDESDQHFRCEDCGRVTFEIISRSPRDVRLEQIEPGKVIRTGGNNYRVVRVLKVGLDEFLVYLRPTDSAPHDGSRRRTHR
jgi:hypothetical protein